MFDNSSASRTLVFTAFDYRYRDAGNFKAEGCAILEGRLSDDERNEIERRLESGEFFIAEQLGIPVLYGKLYAFSGGSTQEDHCWHEFDGFRELIGGAKEGPIWGHVEAFVSAFRQVKDWNVEMSPHFVL